MTKRLLKKRWKAANMRRVVMIDKERGTIFIDRPTFLGFTRLHRSQTSWAHARLGKMLCTSRSPVGYSKDAVRQVLAHPWSRA